MFDVHFPLMKPFQMTLTKSLTILHWQRPFVIFRARTIVRGANVIALVSTLALDALTKTLTLAITFLPEEIGLS